MRAKQLFEERQLKLRDMVADAGKDEFSYDDIISDITELFLSGEKMERNPESLGSSSKSLTTLLWNLGNWRRGTTWRLPSVVDEDKIYYKEHKQDQFPDHVPDSDVEEFESTHYARVRSWNFGTTRKILARPWLEFLVS